MSETATAFDRTPGLRGPHGNRSVRLVLHADDFGMNVAVNQGIVAGFSAGLLTSTSVLANAPAAQCAIEAWRTLDRERASGRLPSIAARRRLNDAGAPFDLGVHLNLTQGRPLTGEKYPAQLLDGEGRFPGVFSLLARLVYGGARFRQPLRRELAAQIEFVRAQGVSITHLNGHQYVEMLPIVAEIVPELLNTFSIPIVRVARERGLTATTLRRSFRPVQWGLAQVKRAFATNFSRRMDRAAVRHPRDYFGTAHAGTIDLPVLERFLSAARSGMTEVGVHPGLRAEADSAFRNDGWDDPLAQLRPRELELLCSDELVELLCGQRVSLARLCDLAGTQRARRAA